MVFLSRSFDLFNIDLSASNLPIGLIPEVMTSNVIVWPASEVILEDGTFKN